MRKLVIGMALASSALATPALARDNAWYLELDFGPMIVEDAGFDIGAVNNGATLNTDYGVDGGGALGYDFGAFRLEAEASYRTADNDDLTVLSPPGIPGLTTTNLVSGTFNNPHGKASVLSFMVNGMLDFGDDNGIQGFVGGGAGISRVDYSASLTKAGPGFLDDTDSGFAWQVIAGLRAPLTDSIDVGVKYRFHNVQNVSLVDSAGRSIDTNWRSHSAMGSLTFNFGGEEAAPPPPPPPPPPPRPLDVACPETPR